MRAGRLILYGALVLMLAPAACTPFGKTSTSTTPALNAQRPVASPASMFEQARAQEAAEDQGQETDDSARVAVIEQEWQLLPEKTEIAAETITFVVTNHGTVPHGFGLRQNGSPVAALRDLTNIQPNETQELVAPLRPGSYELIDPGTYQINGRPTSGSDAGLHIAFKVD